MAQMGGCENIPDDDIVDIRLPAAPVVVHHVGGAKASAGHIRRIRDGGQRNDIVPRFSGDVGNDDIVTSVA